MENGCDRTAEPEKEHSMFSTSTKLCITVIPSTTHRQQIKEAFAEVLPSRLSQSWEDKSPARRFVTRSTTQLKSDA